MVAVVTRKRIKIYSFRIFFFASCLVQQNDSIDVGCGVNRKQTEKQARFSAQNCRTNGQHFFNVRGYSRSKMEGHVISHQHEWCPLSDFRVLWVCLLYTSDAADEARSVDLGGRRII